MSTTPPAGRQPNRLIDEKSPYLLQHAYNPVEWFAYGEEAFEKARAENKPIFLSIGYSTCHWCHVMERECFEDEAIAAVMNRHYVNVKVDREERPDVDEIYMQAALRVMGQGGWPLNVWLDHELRPFYAGTYFPPTPRYGRPGFSTVMETLANAFAERRDEVSEQAEQIMERLRATASGGEGDVPPEVLSRACHQLLSGFDPEWGGFGSAPKFPRPAALMALSHRLARRPSEDFATAHGKTLEMMWRGGLYDHVGGGFTRYSTDRQWLVPHFEKMLYDNAQLVEAYLDGYLLEGEELWADVVRDVLRFVRREMTHPEGGFYSAQDADSEGEEGLFYLFTPAELREVLGDEEAAVCIAAHGVSEGGNFEGRNILHWPHDIESTAASLGLDREALLARHHRWREALYPYREQRIRPGLDDKVLASWNGLMIHAAARAGALLGEPEWLDLAENAARFCFEALDTEGGLLRRWREGEARFEAGLDDHAALAWGAMGLFEAGRGAPWLRRALDLVERCEALFGDAEGGYFSAAEREDLLLRLKDGDDNALPSGNGLLALVQTRLGHLLGRDDLLARAKRSIRHFHQQLIQLPQGHPYLAMANAELEELPRTLTLKGADGPAFRDLLAKAHRALMPGRLIVPLREEDAAAVAELGLEKAERMVPGREELAAFLCEDGACRLFPLPESGEVSGGGQG